MLIRLKRTIMPQLYIDEYTRALAGRTVCVGCREGLLRDHLQAIVSDLKFLNRLNINTVLYHNIANRAANHKYLQLLSERLHETRIVRIDSGEDFYSTVLDQNEKVGKLIFLERKALIDQDGHKINTITTEGLRQGIGALGDLIANTNFMGALEQICKKIDAGLYDRVHIIPAGKNAIKYELFTIEGRGTLIANNFEETFKPVSSIDDVMLIDGILKLYKSEGYLKPRTKDYLLSHRKNYYVTLIDDIVVGCVERKIIDDVTIEIAALAISTRFRNQRVGVFTIKAIIQESIHQGYRRFISLTNNPRLQRLYEMMGFFRSSRPEYSARQAASPNVTMYFIEVA